MTEYECENCGKTFDTQGGRNLHEYNCGGKSREDYMREIVELAGLDESDYTETDNNNNGKGYIDSINKSGARKLVEALRE